MNRLTSTNVHAGRTSANTSPWARAASRQVAMSTSRTRVRITCAAAPPASSIARSMISRQRRVCA
jgi:hypothetical protein